MRDTMEGLFRTQYCGELRKKNTGEKVTVCGFVQRQRELSANLIFVVLRDRTGVVQLTFDKDTSPEIFEKAKTLRSEFVVAAEGVVRIRESINDSIPTGEIEIEVGDLRILSNAETPPFEIRDDLSVSDEIRLKYRYLDLRRPSMQSNLINRHRVTKLARDYFDRNGFIEIETPTLVSSTPEGARDYLVPSRLSEGAFYALPQSPQLFKQLLMIGGYDRYMQISRCYRDEDLRADRQPEFTQIDLEMSFVTAEDVMEVTEGFIRFLFAKFLEMDLPEIKRIPYSVAMGRYGSDKPDTRFGLELHDITPIAERCDFAVFKGTAEAGGQVMSINAKGLSQKLTRKEIDKLTEVVRGWGAKGLAYLRITEDAETSSYEKFLSPEDAAAIRITLDAQVGDVLFIVADQDARLCQETLGRLRVELGKRFSLYDPAVFDVLWVTDFPMFEYSKEEDRYVAMHHPFTAPREEDLPILLTDPGKVRTNAYDIVINGYEAGGGSIRIHDPEVQKMVFEAIGMSDEEAASRFGFFLDAFKYGAPPHGGLALGLDRLMMVLLGTDNIKDVIAFPKLQNGSDPMSGAPGAVDEKQLEELHLKIVKE